DVAARRRRGGRGRGRGRPGRGVAARACAIPRGRRSLPRGAGGAAPPRRRARAGERVARARCRRSDRGIRTGGGPVSPTLLLVACVDRGPGDDPHRVDPSYVQDNLLDAPPTTLTRVVDAHFHGPDGSEVVYLGCDVASTTVVPGDKVSV